MKEPKFQIGPRVTRTVYEALDRLRLAANCSMADYCQQVLTEHVNRLQNNGLGGGAFEELASTLEQLVAKQFARHQQFIETTIKRQERHLTVLKAMIDAHLESTAPEVADTYKRRVEQLMRLITAQNGNQQ
jgi:Ran GTPase-activating protein (RanGAP) involved in mRNA processing and transport